MLAILQLFAIGFILFSATVAARFADHLNSNVFNVPRELPAVLNWSYTVKSYGIWAVVLVMIWTAVSVHSEMAHSPRYVWSMAAVGVGFLALLLFVGILFAVLRS
ncbi:MAG: hypothetical protein WDN28_24490 [Chthoniobacter sp.]